MRLQPDKNSESFPFSREANMPHCSRAVKYITWGGRRVVANARSSTGNCEYRTNEREKCARGRVLASLEIPGGYPASFDRDEFELLAQPRVHVFQVSRAVENSDFLAAGGQFAR